MSFIEHLKETIDTKIYMNFGVAGSSLAISFSQRETKKILDAIKSNPNLKGLSSFVKDVESDREKYSDIIVIDTGKSVFSLYSADGLLRLGGGGSNLSRRDFVHNITSSDVIKALQNAKIAN